MKMIKQVLGLSLALIASFQASALAKVEVTWTNPDKYFDVKDSFNGMRDTQENAFYNIEKVLDRLAKKLPDGYVLALNVTDLDLAGETHTGKVRIIRAMYPPRIEFSYKLLDAQGNVIQRGEENIRDNSFMHNVSLRYENEAFGFEKTLIDNWFKDSFADQFVDKM